MNNLENVVQTIKVSGPDRVMVDQYTAMSPKRAREHGSVAAEVVFIRDDGWSLGAPKHLETFAFQMWSDCWTHFLRIPEMILRKISEYRS